MSSSTGATSNKNHRFDAVPAVKTLADIYPSAGALGEQGARWDRLASAFADIYGRAPAFVARAPGRVNIIGDHVDHQGFSCLPAAIEKDVLMAVSVVPALDAADPIEFYLANTRERFKPVTLTAPSVLETDGIELIHHDEGAQRWGNYFAVAWKGLHSHLPPSVLSASSRPRTINILVDGTIPPESSLSSSAAMTVCSSLVILEAFGARSLVDRTEMAEVAIESERLVGVNSGGMDQAASIFGVPSHALHIAFKPKLLATPTALPRLDPPMQFVIVNTLVVSDKKVTGPIHYNLRTVELRMASRILQRRLALALPSFTTASGSVEEDVTVRSIFKAWLAQQQQGQASADEDVGDETEEQLSAFVKVALDHLPEGAVTRAQVEEATGLSGEAYDKEFLQRFPIRADTFKLRARVSHVLSESARVLAFKSVCARAAGSSSSGAEAYKQLAELMNASHASLRDEFGSSCAELDEIVDIALKNGAWAARQTGAGWGGSAVTLVPQPDVARFIEAVRTGYYAKRYSSSADPSSPQYKSAEELESAVLVSEPAGGACIYHV
ncbi:galactokinase [Tilletia horrida]|nr:galactokinase [Tilletia horrida]